MSDERFPTLYVDRSDWEPGPWHEELDRYEWKSEHGFPCLMVRNKRGHWCGYVGVTPNHPWHGKRSEWESPLSEIEVHGGVTYTEECAGQVCHVPDPGEPEHLWWIGFDCCHAWDYSPGEVARDRRLGFNWGVDPDKRYRDADYVRRQCERMARQANEAGK
jgi:hypothetical protein